MNTLCCCKDPAVNEIWRLRLNWLFLILSSLLVAINICSVTSFHQFVTNPTSDKINITVSKLESGLGLTEQFYSASIALFYTGEFIGAIIAGFLIQIVPYWYVTLTSLLIYTVSYVMYALTTMGWLLMLSRLLSGGFIGVIVTVAPTYFGHTNEMYVMSLKELGKCVKDSNVRVKDSLFALHSLGLGCGFLIGTGVTMIFSQFDISQFRSIAWFNTAAGLAFVVLQLVMFQGESKCRKPLQLGQQFRYMCEPQKPAVIWIDVLVTIFLVLAAPAHSLLTVTYMVLFNPILGDSFGFSERESSYAFFVLTAAQIAGALITILLLSLKLSNRIISIIGVIISITAFTLLADWQSIPYDPCTEHSLFHHPELVSKYKQEIKNASGSLHEIDLMPGDRSTESPIIHWQLIEIVGTKVYHLAAGKCESLHTSTGCHWIPTSSVTKKNCTDCQPICRSEYGTLNFIQFCIGAMLLLIAHPTISVSMTNLITDVTHKQLHGVVLGIAFASGAVSKIISPLWMDAAYEGTQKRSFLPMAIMVGINLLLLLGFVILFRKLGKREKQDQKFEDKTYELEQ